MIQEPSAPPCRLTTLVPDPNVVLILIFYRRRPLYCVIYRNSINIGLPIIECPEAAKAINAGDDVEVDFDSGVITDKTTGQSFKGQAFPEFMQKIIKAEGLINYINNK